MTDHPQPDSTTMTQSSPEPTNLRSYITKNWVTIVIVALVIGLVVAAKVASSSSSTPTTPTTTQVPHPTTTTHPATPTSTQPQPTSSTIPISKLGKHQREVAIVVTGALMQIPNAPQALTNKLVAATVAHLPASYATQLIYPLGTYPGHPELVKLTVGSQPLCLQQPTHVYPLKPQVVACP